MFFREIEFRIKISYKNKEDQKSPLKDIPKKVYSDNYRSFDKAYDLYATKNLTNFI